MKFLSIIALAGLVFAANSVEASATRKKVKGKDSFFSETQRSKPEYSVIKPEKRVKDPQSKTIRSPEKPGVQSAPKGKLRRKSHISEGF